MAKKQQPEEIAVNPAATGENDRAVTAQSSMTAQSSVAERAIEAFDAQNWSSCIELCNLVLQETPRDHAILEILATAYLHDNNTEQALEMMQRLLQISPRDPLHRLKLAALLQMQGRLGEAMIEFSRVVQLYPNSVFAQEAEEAIEVLDKIQIQQVLTRAAEQYEFGLLLQRDMESALENNAYRLSESGNETLRQMVWDGRMEIGSEPTAPRIH